MSLAPIRDFNMPKLTLGMTSTHSCQVWQHGVSTLTRGREVDEDAEVVVDAVSAGLASLTTGTDNPLIEYNTSFSKLQHRRRMAPVDLEDTETPLGPPWTPSPSSSTTSDSNLPSLRTADAPLTSPSDVPARLWPMSPSFGLVGRGFGFPKVRPGPTLMAPAWPGLALAQAGAFHVAVQLFCIW